MQDTRSNFFSVFLSIIDVEVAKTATSFLTSLGTCLHSDPFICRYNIHCGSSP